MSPPLTITGPWRALVDHSGSVTALARELGTTRSTLHRWIVGDVAPSTIVRGAVNAWAKRHRLAPPFAEAA